jgi:hypothetical protein
MSNEPDSDDAGRSLSPRIKIRIEGGKLHITAARSLAAGLMVAIVFALLGSLGLLGIVKNRYGDTKESRLLFASFGYLAAIVCMVATFQKEHLVLDPREKDQLIHGAKVVRVDSGWLHFDYDDKTLILDGTSGAPVLNEAGDVVGINAGASEQEGRSIGFAVGVDAARKVLASR